MEGIYLILGLIVAFMVALFLWMDRRWKKLFEEQKIDPASQAMWSLIQQQMEQLRVQMNDGLNRNILQLTEQQRAVNEQLRGITDQVNRQLQTSIGEVSKRLDHAAKVIGDVQKNIGELSQASRQIFEVGKNIATLQEILQPPKLRGGMGELFLGELLSQTDPPVPIFYSPVYVLQWGKG
jgi:DNA anti-recombination protein RmuC